jgi:ascorbate-specific PTS system EIIC-type component UlaA
VIGQRIFNVIASLAASAIGFLAIGTGGYLVWSVMPDWLIKAALGVILILLGGTTLASTARAVSQALDRAREH